MSDDLHSPPDASALFLQLWVIAMNDEAEPKPGQRGFDPAKWHRAWADCALLVRHMQRGESISERARAIASGSWGNQVPG